MSSDQTTIVLVSTACALGVGAVGLALAWLLRQRSIRWQLGLLVVVSVGSVLAGFLAVSQLMFVSHHDLGVLTLVALVSGVVALLVALGVGAAVSHWSERLRQDVGRLDSHGSYVASARGPVELNRVSEQLAVTSERLEQSRLREARLEESRRELVSWVSHDLRTPLAGMRAMSEALEDGIAADPARYQRQIRVEVDRMVRMVDDLFELSRIHAGVLRMAPETVDLGDLVSEAIAGADQVARSRSVRLGGSVEPGVEVTADPSGLSRVVTNLVMNAIRHTPADGTVEIHARSTADGVELSVRDQCGGLSAEELERVFDLAWRGEPARTPHPAEELAGVGGAGLGLAIVKGIVEAHRGVVRVENVTPTDASDPDGCRFLVRLPG